ncbi:restriction endonuclease [Ralstonia pseudosolanacearum]|uniref:restriction endonuclease n=1 Tax=Ralstonia pseudosolanacearum TaxID=1310165 RepID=UPI001FFBFB82|nr:restriction endonuclease [Ralstonia pseudosolanacearum]MDO3620597.1 restriction endonuclease [Ralstonia pseudosolanacearum]
MSIPSYDKFIEPILRYLARHSTGMPAKDAYEAAAHALDISDVEKQELLVSSSQPVYRNRAGWAHDRLKRAGLSSSPRRGHWQLTEQGFRFAENHPSPLSAKEVEELALGFVNVRLKAPDAGDVLSTPSLNIPAQMSAATSPDDRLSDAVSEIRETVARELLETLAGVSPSFFETIVLDLLHRMGYGASRSDLVRVGGSGDGGIDGVISLDKLGLEKVYVQAKRWQSTVGRPDIQAFFGALAGQRAKKGVFITTSSYTVQAIEFARSVEGIVLVDGVKLTEFMMDNEVGVSVRTINVPKIDSDYFDEGAA